MPKSGDKDDDVLGDATDPAIKPGRGTESFVGPPPASTGSGPKSGPKKPPRKGDAPSPHEDEWASYNDEEEGWDVTSARVQQPSTQSGSTGDFRLHKEPTASQTGPTQGFDPLVEPPSGPSEAGTQAPTSALKSRLTADGAAPTPDARLEGIQGGDAGRTFSLDREEITLGRDPSQNLVLLDPSTSREHARIVRDESGYVVVDNKSGNGTFVNGQRVERSRLQTGDDVAFGNTHFRFLAGGEIYRPPVALEVEASQAPTPLWREKLPLVIAAGVLGFVLLVAGLLQLRQTQWGGRKRAEIYDNYVKGIAAFDDHQWDAAESAFRAMLALDPRHVRARRYLKSVARQRDAQGDLAVAQVTCRSTEYATCVAQATPLLDTVFLRDAKELLRGVDDALEQQVARAQTALDNGDVPVAMTALQGVESVRPGRPDVAALLTRATQTPTKPLPKPVRIVPRNRWPSAGPVAEAIRLFSDGDVPGARAALDKAQSDDAGNLRTLLNQFKEAYEAALVQHRGKRAFNAIRLFNQAKTIEAKITSGQSKLVSGIDLKLADMYYVLGMEAYLGNKLPEAADDFRTAVGLAPDHALSVHKLHELEQKAQELFDEAQQLKDSDTGRARANLETVVEMLTPKNELYRKAQSRLSALK